MFLLAPIANKMMERIYTQRVTLFDATPIPEGSVVLLGDSITEGARWEELLPGHPVINRGISGDTTAGVLKRLDGIIAAKAAKLFILIGTNDIHRGEKPAVIAENLRQIITRVQAGSPDTEIFVQSVMPREKKRTPKVLALNTLIKDVASSTGVAFIDHFALFAEADSTMKPSLSNDNVHLLGAGYLVWRDALLEHLAPTVTLVDAAPKAAVKKVAAKKTPATAAKKSPSGVTKKAPAKKVAAKSSR